MSLNVSRLNQQELTTLAQCDFRRSIIAIDTKAEGGPKIITLSRDDVTCWQLFLRWFNCGTLADKQVHLRDVAYYLNQFNWASAAVLDQNSIGYNAYLKTCILANKALYHKWDETLFNNVSPTVVEKRARVTRPGSNPIEANIAVRHNPALQIQHLRTLIERQFRNARIAIEDAHHRALPRETYISLDALRNLQIHIEELPVREYVPVPVPVPVHHHHHHHQPRRA